MASARRKTRKEIMLEERREPFARALEQLIYVSGASDSEVAMRSGLSPSGISRILSRKRTPEPETIAALARGLRLNAIEADRLRTLAGYLPDDPANYMTAQGEGEIALLIRMLMNGRVAESVKSCARAQVRLIAAMGSMSAGEVPPDKTPR